MCIKYSAYRYHIEDNYQEVLAELYKCIHTYTPERGSIKSWLCTIAKYTVLDKDRKHCRHSHSNTAFEYDFSQVADDYSYYDVASSRKADYLTNYKLLFSDEILDALDALEYIHREALLLHLAGYKLREIADISYRSGNLKNRSTYTIGSRLFKAKQQMRRLIDEHGNRRRV
jgi:RNA polymerase sigma factor (sigma-70 family)